MVGLRWTTIEKAVILFYASRGVEHQACSEILDWKCGTDRGLSSVRTQLAKLRTENPRLYNDNERTWNVNEVDIWIREQELPDMTSFLSFGADENRIMAKVWHVSVTWKSFVIKCSRSRRRQSRTT